MGMNKVVIDVEARFTDNVSGQTGRAESAIDKMGKAADRAQKKLNSVKTKPFKPVFDADNSRFLKKLRDTEHKMGNLGKHKTKVMLEAVDKATTTIGKVLNTAKKFGRGAYKAVLTVRAVGLNVISKTLSGLRSVTKRAWTATLRVKDFVTAPIQKLKSSLFSIKTLIAAIAGGIAMKKLAIEPTKMFANYEDLVTQFSVLLGSQDAARKRMSSLVDFAGQTPFTRDEIFQASRILQTYTNGALATPDSVGGLKMIGDVAAATGEEYTRVANYFGRLYNEVARGGEALGEPLMMLREIGALSAENEKAITDIAQGSGTIEEKWAQIAQQFSKTDGMMEAMSDQMNNLMLGVKSFLKNNLYMKLGEGISESLKPFLMDFRKWRSDNKDLIAGWADSVKNFAALVSGKVLGAVRNLAKRADTLFRSDAFQNASLGGKIKMAWDTLVADPISDWWNNGGQAKTVAAANKIGGAIGGLLNGAILGVLGFTGLATDIGSDGGSVAGAFVQGFLDGFDGDAIKTAIKDALGNVWDTFKGASLGGKLMTAGITAAIGNKLFGPLLKGGWSVLKGGGGLLGRLIGRFAGRGGGAGGLLGQAVSTMHVSAGAVYVNGPILGGKGGKGGTGGTGTGGGGLFRRMLGRGAASAPLALPGEVAGGGGAAGGGLWATLSRALPFLKAGGGIFAGITALKGAQEARRGQKRYDQGDVIGGGTQMGKGYSKLGMTGAGAMIGSIFPGVGTLLGAGIGAGAGWLFGPLMDKSEKLAQHAKQTHNSIKGSVGEAKNLGRAFEESVLYDDNPIQRLENGLERLKFKARMGEYQGIYKEPTMLERAKSYKYQPSRGRSFEAETPKPKSLLSSMAEKITIKASYQVQNQDDPVAKVHQSIPDTMTKASSVIVAARSSITGLGNVASKIKSKVPSSVSASTTLTVRVATNIVGGVGNIWGKVKAAAGLGKGFRGGIFGGTSSMRGYSDGGIVSGGSQLIKVAEEGSPEMVIPLSSQRRKRGLRLWEKAGEMLKVPGFAQGGRTDNGPDETLRAYRQSNGEASASPQSTIIDVGGVTVQITVQAGAEGNVADAVREQRDEIAEEVAGIMHDVLSGVFENTPPKGGAA